MNRINTSTAEANANGAGKTGFTDGAPLEAIPPTQLNAEFFNSVQEEICGVIEGNGLSVNPLLQNQLLSIMRQLPRAEANWINRTGEGITAQINGICCTEDPVNPFWLAVGVGGASWISIDGVEWASKTQIGAGGSVNANFVRYSSALGQFLVGCSDGSAYTSPDGVTWTKTIDPTVTGFAVSLVDAVYLVSAGDGWIVIGGNGVVLRQIGGVWSNAGYGMETVSTFAVTAIARDWAGNLRMTDAGSQVWSCAMDATLWTGPIQVTGIAYPAGAALRSVVWDGYAGWIACGDNGRIAQSNDGTGWQLVSTPNIAASTLYAVATSAPVGTAGLALAQAPAGGALVVVGQGPTVLTAFGPQGWKIRPLESLVEPFLAIYWSPTNGYWTAVGIGGSIINSLRT